MQQPSSGSQAERSKGTWDGDVDEVEEDEEGEEDVNKGSVVDEDPLDEEKE